MKWNDQEVLVINGYEGKELTTQGIGRDQLLLRDTSFPFTAPTIYGIENIKPFLLFCILYMKRSEADSEEKDSVIPINWL